MNNGARENARVNATATGPLNPHDPYWGRFEGGGNAFGGVDTLRPGERTRDIYADLQRGRELAIKDLQAKTFGGGGISRAGRSLQPVDALETNASTKFASAQNLVLTNSMNAQYGAKPDPYGVYGRSIQLVNSFSYEPRNAYTFNAQYSPSTF